MKKNLFSRLSLFTCYILFCFLSSQSVFGNASVINPKSGKIYLTIYYKEAQRNDTLTLGVDNTLNTALEVRKNELKAVADDMGCFKFVFQTNEPHGYFTLLKPQKLTKSGDPTLVPILKPQFWEAGDNVTMWLSHQDTNIGIFSTCRFSGHGAEKYNVVNELDNFKMDPEKVLKIKGFDNDFTGNVLRSDGGYGPISDNDQAKLDLLDKHKNSISRLAYDIIKADVLFSWKSGFFDVIARFRLDSMENTDKATKKKFLDRYNSFYKPRKYGVSEEGLANSPEYLCYLGNKLRSDSYVNVGKLSMDWIYKTIRNSNESSKVKDYLTIMLFLRPIHNSENAATIYADAEKTIHRPECLTWLDEIKARSPGKPFTNFSLKDEHGNLRSLSEFKNKVVLIDFWFTGCGHCQDLYREALSGTENILKDNPDVIFLSVSIDRDKPTWQKSVESGTYTSEHAINLFTNGQGNNHPIITKNNIQGYPCLVLLDKASKIKYFNSASLYREASLIKAIQDLL